MTMKQSVGLLGVCLWIFAVAPVSTRAQDIQPGFQADQPAYWLAHAEQSIQHITDPDDPNYATLIRVEALSLLARSHHDLGDAEQFSEVIQSARRSSSQITDEDFRNEARWALAEALAQAGRFDEAQHTVDAITDPAIQAPAMMTLAVAKTRRGSRGDRGGWDDYQRISAAAEEILVEAFKKNDPDDLSIDDVGWAWLTLVHARLDADDVQGALAQTEKYIQHPADLTAALAAISEKQAELGDKQAASVTLDSALNSLRQLQAILEEKPDTFADTDLAYAALARAHAALGQQAQANKMLALIDMAEFKAEALSACAVHLATQDQIKLAQDSLAQARVLLDQPANPLWINHWSWFEMSKNSMRVGCTPAHTQWIVSLKDPTTRALAELGALRGLIERAKHSP